MMKRIFQWSLVTAGLAAAMVDVGADNRLHRVSAILDPGNEVPAVSSPAKGQFLAIVDREGESVEYWLSYNRLQANVTQAHIHFAQPNVNGAIMVWLCGTAANPGPPPMQPPVPAPPECPPSGQVSGIITPEHVLAITTQGIEKGDFADFVGVLRSGLAYANVHTTQSPAGEIRGQVELVRRFFGR